MEDIGIYINSFDGCSDIWPVFFKIWDTYWTECPYQMYLTSNYKNYNYKNLKVLKVGKEKTWLDRTIKTLEMVSQKYIIFFLEDYFISKKINLNEIEEICKHMHHKNLFYYQLSNRGDLKKNDKHIKAKKSLMYPISLQLSIWDRIKLIEILKNMDSIGNYTSPWDFERYFVEKYKNTTGPLLGVEYDTRDLMGYKNGVLQGKWIRATIKFYKKRNIKIDCSQREIMSLKETFYYNVKKYFSLKLSGKSKVIMKMIMKKFGYTFMTD